MNYDFDKLKGLYELNDEPDNKTSDVFSSFGELDEVENDDSLYNELVPSSTYNLEDTIRLERSVFDGIKEVSPTTDGLTPELLDIPKDNKLEDTLEIDTFELDNELGVLLEDHDEKKKEAKPRKKWFHLPITVAEDHHLEHAFVNCAVLGFITAAMGSGMLMYILNQINAM